MQAVVARIALRYVAAALVTHGLLTADVGGTLSGDPDVLMLIQVVAGAGIGIAIEGWYALARRFGWET